MAVLQDARIVSGSHDSTLRIWNVTSGKCEMVLEGHHGVSDIVVMCTLNA